MSNDPHGPASGTQPYAGPASLHDNPTLAASPPTLPHGLPPELIDHPRYRVLRLLGTGGMGAVYQAEHRVMERLVALKIMRADLTADAAAVERFRREVKAAGTLAHPNIVTAFDADQIGNIHFLVMEYVEGIDLARHVAQRGPLSVIEACGHIRQASLGLQHAFERGMIHRDIKPHNLMLAGTIKILDFGLARLAGAPVHNAQTVSGMILGTVDFMAPEQADDARTVDIRADIYSLGSTLYYLLSGRVPFPNGTLLQKVVAIMERQPPSLTEFRTDLPPRLLTVVARLLAKKPEDRYQTPAEVADALAPFFDGDRSPTVLEEHVPVAALIEEVEPAETVHPLSATAVLPRVQQGKARPRRFASRGLWVAGTCVLVMVALCAGGAWLAGSSAWRYADSYSNIPHTSWDDLDRTWQPPPADAATDRLLPTHIGSFQRQNLDEFADVPLLGIKGTGRHAEYKDFWKMELSVFKVSEDEEKVLYNIAYRKVMGPNEDQAGQNGVGRNTVKGGPGRPWMVYELHPFNLTNLHTDLPKGAVWCKDGWLFILQTDNMVDPQKMMRKYLER